jgi:DNA-binding transcriptional LysR family regulator
MVKIEAVVKLSSPDSKLSILWYTHKPDLWVWRLVVILDNLNLNLLRIFESVYRLSSMTKAAVELHMTQSGVSQNIKNLEDMLQVVLFDRIKQKPIPTDKADELYQFCHPFLVSLEGTLISLTEKSAYLKGCVHIGLPIEFGNNVVLPMLAKWAHQHPELEFRFRYDLAPRLQEDLLAGLLDFAIVDDFSFDQVLEVEKVASEILVLCLTQNLFDQKEKAMPKKKSGDKERAFFETLDYVDYVEDAPILMAWFHHHYDFSNFRPRMRAALMDVQGIARMIIDEMGAGVLPLHVVKKLDNHGIPLKVIDGKNGPLRNHLNMVKLKKRSLSREARETLEFITGELKKREAKQRHDFQNSMPT